MSGKNQGGRIYGGLNTEQRKAQRRQKFVDAGLEVFGTEGFQSATVRKLCRQAGLTDRYYYESFSSTEDLLMAVYSQCMETLQSKLFSAVSDFAPGNDEHRMVYSWLDAFLAQMEDRRIARVVMIEVWGVSEKVDEHYNYHVMQIIEVLIDASKRLFPHLRLTSEELEITGMTLIGAMRQTVLHWMHHDYQIDRETVVNGSAQIFLGLVERFGKKNLE